MTVKTGLTRYEEDQRAAELLKDIDPELAALLAARVKLGPKEHKGPTDHNKWLADVWFEIEDDIKRGKAEEQALADAQIRHKKLSEDYLYDLWHLRGRPAVKAIVKDRKKRAIRAASSPGKSSS